MISQDDIDAMTEEVATLPSKTKALTHFMKTLKPTDFVAGHIGSLISKCFYAGWEARKTTEYAKMYGHDDRDAYIKAMEDFLAENLRAYDLEHGVQIQSRWCEDSPMSDPTGLVSKLLLRKEKENANAAAELYDI